MNTPRLFITHFAFQGRDTFAPVLARWWTHYAASRCSLPVSILTDTNELTCPVPAGVHELHVLPHPKAPRRDGNPYDYKSALICGALPLLPAGAVILDSDAIFQRDPADALQAYMDEPFAMPPDSGRRRIPWKHDTMPSIQEHSSSVMVFGDNSPGMREAIVESYIQAWLWLAENDDAKGQIDRIREQRAWSLVHYWSDAPLMDELLNWSASHYKPNADAFVIHHHGSKKLQTTR